MYCRDVMKTTVIRCHEHESVSECARRMAEFGVGFLPVLDGTETVVGVITDRDLALRVLGGEKDRHTLVRDVMSRDVQVCHPEDSVRWAEERMVASHKSRLVVVDARGRGVGVISLSDLARMDGGSRTGWLLNAVTRRDAAGAGAAHAH
jgi:CBS domain-containing protein